MCQIVERLGIFWILQTQRVERARRCLTAGGDNLTEQFGDALTEQRFETATDKAREFLKRQPADQQCLEADRNLALQRPGDIQGAMQQIGDPQVAVKFEQRAGRTVVADPSLGPGGIEDQIGVAQQALDRRTRHRTLGMVVEDDPTLPVGERHEPDPDPVAIRYRLLQIGLRGQLVDAPVKGSGCGAQHLRRDPIFRGGLADGRVLGSMQYGPAELFPRARELPAGPASDDAVLVTCAYLTDPSRPWVMQSLFLTAIGDVRERGARALEAFAYRYPEGETTFDRFHVHRTIFPADFLADFGFLPVRTKGRVELARLELGGLQPVEEGKREQVLARVREAFLPAPELQRP